VDINRADKEMLLRVPGLATKAVGRILSARRYRAPTLEDLAWLTAPVIKVRPFTAARGWRSGQTLSSDHPRASPAPKP